MSEGGRVEAGGGEGKAVPTEKRACACDGWEGGVTGALICEPTAAAAAAGEVGI